MFDLPERFKTDISVNIKDFIPKDLKPDQKRRIREAVKAVSLTHQIAGEEIPSTVTEEYIYQVIQVYDLELFSVKDAAFLSGIYQELIKPPCVIRLHDSRNEMYSLALKRLNRLDNTQVVAETSVLTDSFPVGLPTRKKDRLAEYTSYDRIINKTSKLNYYRELFAKVYLLKNDTTYQDTQRILDGNIWYDGEKANRMFQTFKGLVDMRGQVKKAVTNADRMKLNQEIRALMDRLDNEQF